MNRFMLLLAGCFLSAGTLFGQLQVTDFETLQRWISEHSYTIQNGAIEMQQAQKSKLAALLGIPDPNGSVSFSYTDNTRLPVNLFPAELLGGAPGEYQEVQLGVQYVSALNSGLDLKLWNPAGWQQYRLARLQPLLRQNEQALQLKTLLENVAAVYFDIQTLMAQDTAGAQYLAAADSLLRFVEQQHQLGLASTLDLHQARVLVLQQQEQQRQTQFQIGLQIQALKLLADMPDSLALRMERLRYPDARQPDTAPENRPWRTEQARLLTHQAQTRLSLQKAQVLPTVSVFFNYQSQQFNTRANPFADGARWIPSHAIGLKLQVPLPGSQTIGAFYREKYQLQLARNQEAQAVIKDNLEQNILRTKLEKARSSVQSAQEILVLQRESYEKNRLNYQAGLIPLNDVVGSFNTLIGAEYNFLAAQTRLAWTHEIIRIHHSK